MSFEEWWANKIKTYELSRAAHFYCLVKMLADSAWKQGLEEGSIMALQVLKNHEANTNRESLP